MDISDLEVDYPNLSDYFRLRNVYNTVLFLFFVFMMCIIILSLFEGIAVGEIKIVLDKAHIEIMSAEIAYVLKIQTISYFIYKRLLFTTKEPKFMNFKELYVKKKDKEFKSEMNNVEPIKKIGNDLTLISFTLENLMKQLNQQTSELKSIIKEDSSRIRI